MTRLVLKLASSRIPGIEREIPDTDELCIPKRPEHSGQKFLLQAAGVEVWEMILSAELDDFMSTAPKSALEFSPNTAESTS